MSILNNIDRDVESDEDVFSAKQDRAAEADYDARSLDTHRAYVDAIPGFDEEEVDCDGDDWPAVLAYLGIDASADSAPVRLFAPSTRIECFNCGRTYTGGGACPVCGHGRAA